MKKIIEFYSLEQIDNVKYFTTKCGSDQRCIPDQRLGLERLILLGKEILQRDNKVTKQTHFRVLTNTYKPLTGYIEGVKNE